MGTLTLASSSGSVSLTPQTAAGSVTLTLPAVAGTVVVSGPPIVMPTATGSNGQVLRTDGAGNLSWVTSSSGITVGTTTITGGTAGSIPFNNGTVYSEDNANLFWDAANIQLYIGGNIYVGAPPNIELFVSKDAYISGITAGRGAGQDTSNTVFGAGALATNSSINNTAFGSQALASNTGGGGGNTGIGRRALADCTGARNTAVGRLAMSFAQVQGNENTALGISALGFLTTGSGNTGLGKLAGSAITTGSNNVIIGSYDGSTAPISASGSSFIVLSDGQGNTGAYWDGLTKNQFCGGPVIMKGYTVATLPTPTIEGMRAYVTDASAPTFLTAVVGGGAVKCPVFFDGTSWVCA